MKPSLIKSETTKCMGKQIPVFIWGPPGCGKSDIIKEIGKEMELQVFDNRASQMEPPDVRGMPYIYKGKMHWAPPALLPAADGSDGPSIVFLDELPQGSDSVQTALFQLCRDRRIGSYLLPDDCVIVAAGNRTTDRSGAKRVLQALNNRFLHLDFEVDLGDWSEWAIKSGKISSTVLAFIRFRPELLMRFDPDKPAFPTPRTWEYLSNYLGMDAETSDDTEFESLSGLVGEGAAAEFTGFLKIWRNLPNIDGIIMDPKKASVPTDPATLYAVATALAERATEDSCGRILTYADRIQSDYQVVLIKDAITRDATLGSTKEFNEWAIRNNDVLL